MKTTKSLTLTRKHFLIAGLGTLGGALLPTCGGEEGGGTGGTTGGAGTTGAGGTTGAAGTTGDAGTTGGAGTTGAAGTTGDAGTTGGAGTTGAAGRGGTTGAGGRGGAGGTTGGGGTTGAGGRGGGTAGTSGTNSCTGAVSAAISGNHGHVLTIPLADIMAGAQKCYNAAGTAGHPHYIILTAADFTALRNGGNVIKFSCNGGDHQYVLSCLANAPVPQTPPECTTTSTQGSTAC